MSKVVEQAILDILIYEGFDEPELIDYLKCSKRVLRSSCATLRKLGLIHAFSENIKE